MTTKALANQANINYKQNSLWLRRLRLEKCAGQYLEGVRTTNAEEMRRHKLKLCRKRMKIEGQMGFNNKR